MLTGGCHCGAIRYEADGEPEHHALCHCVDCRRCSGAPMVGWMAFPAEAVRVTQGEAAVYASSADARRHFCIQCGTGLFYTNAVMLPGIVDIQSATLDDIENQPPGAQIQVAERLPWMADLGAIPEFLRYPAMD
jgi:hypothetical protein